MSTKRPGPPTQRPSAAPFGSAPRGVVTAPFVVSAIEAPEASPRCKERRAALDSGRSPRQPLGASRPWTVATRAKECRLRLVIVTFEPHSAGLHLHVLERTLVSVLCTREGDLHHYTCEPLGVSARGKPSVARGNYLVSVYDRVLKGPVPSGFLTEAEVATVHHVRSASELRLAQLVFAPDDEVAMLALAASRARGLLGRCVYPPSRTPSSDIRAYLAAIGWVGAPTR